MAKKRAVESDESGTELAGTVTFSTKPKAAPKLKDILMSQDAAIQYVKTKRKSELTALLEETRTAINASNTRYNDIRQKLPANGDIAETEAAVVKAKDLAAKLDVFYKENNIPLTATISKDNCSFDFRTGIVCVPINVSIPRGIKMSDIILNQGHSVFVSLPATAATVKPLVDEMRAEEKYLAQLNERFNMINSELQNANNVAEETKAALFASTMEQSDEGQLLIAALDQQLAGYKSVSKVAALPPPPGTILPALVEAKAPTPTKKK